MPAPTASKDSPALSVPSLLSRREALARGTALVAAALATVAAPASAQADSVRDSRLLNGLLATEYNALLAYDAGLGVLLSPPAGDPLASVAPAAAAVALHFQNQHRDHARALVTLIRDAGGTPVDPASVAFEPRPGFTPTVGNVVVLAANAEKIAAVLYADVLRSMGSRAAARVVAAIGGVETQHYIVLSLIAQGMAVPTAMTQALALDVVPRSFVAAAGSDIPGLENIPDFSFT